MGRLPITAKRYKQGNAHLSVILLVPTRKKDRWTMKDTEKKESIKEYKKVLLEIAREVHNLVFGDNKNKAL